MDVDTEEPLLDGDTPITAQITFTPEASEGTVDVVFEFNGTLQLACSQPRFLSVSDNPPIFHGQYIP